MPERPSLPAGLYALCDDGVRPELGLEQKARALLAGGVKVIQVRLKRTPIPEALRALRAIVPLCRAAGTLCLVNDRVDLALLTGADGAHVGDEDLPPEDARALLGPRRILGVTVRSSEAARRAASLGADYVGVGPVFATQTKQVGVQPLGLAGLASVAAESPVPVVAIAGIRLDTIAEVGRAGAHGAAVVSDLLCAEDIAGRAVALEQAFEQGRGLRSRASNA